MTETTPRKLSHYFTASRRKGRAGLPLMSVTMHNGLVRRDELDRKMDSALTPEEHLLVEPNDIAYNTMRMWQGCFGLAEEAANVSPAYVVMRPKDTVDPRFAAHWFKSDRGLYMLWAYSYGLTEDRLRLYGDEFLLIPVSWPEKQEQTRIATILDAWDDAIHRTNSLAAARQRAMAGSLRTLFSPAIDTTLARSGWQRTQIGKLAKIVGGGTPDTTTAAFWGGEIPWCTPTDLRSANDRFIHTTERKITEAGLKNSSATILPEGSIVLCSRASIGECAISTIPMATNQGFQSLVPHETSDRDFIFYLVNALKRQLLRISAGSTFLEFGRNELRGLPVQVPDAEERTKIGRQFADMDDEIRAATKIADLLRRQKRGLMQKLLTGEWQISESIDLFMPGGDAAATLAREANAA